MGEQRRQFQAQELITARPYSYIFSPCDPPRIVWRDVDLVRQLGADGDLVVRWFDADLNEAETPNAPGRWCAWIEGTAPNGTPVRRSMTFYCRPPGFLLYLPADFTVDFPPQPGPIDQDVWREHQEQISRVSGEIFLRTFNDSEAGAILIAGLAEAVPQGRPARQLESAEVRNEEYHLALKLKMQGLAEKVRPLQPPRRREDDPAPVLREGSPADAGVHPETPARLDAICRAWAAESQEPFVVLVAHRGTILIHQAYGKDGNGDPIGLDYRADVASITKSVTGMLFSLFLDQGLIDLDDSLATVFADYPSDDPRVPTFRQCFTHTSGLRGHGDFDGVRNSHLENIVLNGLDVLEPGKAYNYTGMGFDLAAKAMEIVSGKSAMRLYHDHLFGPLGLGEIPMDNASAGARFTAHELGTLAQWMANRGSYGAHEFISAQTFERMLPAPLANWYPGVTEVEGIGMHWMTQTRSGESTESPRPEELIFSPQTIYHGALTGCMFIVDLDQDIVIIQIRRSHGPEFAEWSRRFLLAIADGVAGE